MNRLVVTLFAGVVLLTSCKEKDPPIIPGTSFTDSSWTVTPPQADPHSALLEEFTGASCSNCPAAHDVINSLSGNFNVIGLYINNFPQTDPPPGHQFDFRTDDATTIGTSVYGGISAMPEAGIDRVQQGSSGLLQTSGTWQSSINTRDAIGDSLNLSVQSSVNTSTQIATIIVKVTYVTPTTSQQSLNVAVVEDSLIDVQEFPQYPIGPYPGGYDSTYRFNNVFRDMVSSVSGDPILPAVAQKAAGFVLQRTYSYPLSTAEWVPQNCRVVVFVTNSNNQVLQSAQAKLN